MAEREDSSRSIYAYPPISSEKQRERRVTDYNDDYNVDYCSGSAPQNRVIVCRGQSAKGPVQPVNLI
jgi:hypothetical protein